MDNEKMLEIIKGMFEAQNTELKAYVQGEVSGLRGEMSELKTSLRGEMSELKTSLQGEINGLKSEVGGLKGEMAEVKQGIKVLDQKTTAIQQDIKILSDKMDKGFKDTRSELVDSIETVGQRVDNIAKTINDVETVTAQNAFDVQLMKRRA